MKKAIIILTVLFTSHVVCLAQDFSTTDVEYRVTAVKKGTDNVYSESNTIDVKPPLNLFIPNAFTPNGDGLNDTFGALCQGVDDYSIRLFNRWGELIFESNDVNSQWDGFYKGEKAMPGSYIYEVSASGFYDKTINRKGTVTIIKT